MKKYLFDAAVILAIIIIIIPVGLVASFNAFIHVVKILPKKVLTLSDEIYYKELDL